MKKSVISLMAVMMMACSQSGHQEYVQDLYYHLTTIKEGQIVLRHSVEALGEAGLTESEIRDLQQLAAQDNPPEGADVAVWAGKRAQWVQTHPKRLGPLLVFGQVQWDIEDFLADESFAMEWDGLSDAEREYVIKSLAGISEENSLEIARAQADKALRIIVFNAPVLDLWEFVRGLENPTISSADSTGLLRAIRK